MKGNLLLLSILCFVELLFTWFTIIECFFYNLLIEGVLSAILLITYGGLVALFSARKDNRFSGRRERMENQCGHSVMLLYFWGLAPITECWQYYVRGIKRGNPKSQLNMAVIMHLVGETFLQSMLRMVFRIPVAFDETHKGQVVNLLLLISMFGLLLLEVVF